MRDLETKGKDSSIKHNDATFLTVSEFITFYNKHAWHYTTGGDDLELQICVTDICGLLALAYYDKDESTTKDIANLKAVVKKAVYQGVESMVFQNSFLKLLLEAFGKNKLAVVTQVALSTLPTLFMFNTQVKASLWSQNMLLRVKVKSKLLCAQVREELRGSIQNMANECINAAKLFIKNCLLGCCQSTAP